MLRGGGEVTVLPRSQPGLLYPCYQFTVTNSSVFRSPGPSPPGLPGGHAAKAYGQGSKENRSSKWQKLLSINAILQLNSSELGNDALYECFDYLLLSLPTVTPFVPIMTT